MSKAQLPEPLKLVGDKIHYSEKTKKFIIENKGEVILILGVIPGEDRFEERFKQVLSSHKIVFADKYSPAEEDTSPFIQSDFNSYDCIEELYKTFPKSFKIIITDGIGVTKFLISYTYEYLKILKEVLSDKGSLILHDKIDLEFYDEKKVLRPHNVIFLSKEELDSKKIESLKNGKIFLSPLKLPLSLIENIAISNDEFESKFPEIRDVALQANRSRESLLEAASRVEKLGFTPRGIITGNKIDENTLKDKVMQQLKEKEFFRQKKPSLLQQVKATIQEKFTQAGFKIEIQDLNSSDNMFIPKDYQDTEYTTYITYTIPTAASLIGVDAIDYNEIL